jgi:methyl-accepting chemotaxis protein
VGSLPAYLAVAWGSIIAAVLTATNQLVMGSGDVATQSKMNFNDLTLVLLTMFLCVWLANYISSSLKRSNDRLNQQAIQLQKALEEIGKKRIVSERVSRRVFSVTTELNATANQQASGSQQQASALSQVTAFLQEMTSTAQAIANKTDQLSLAAAGIKQSALRVKTTGSEVIEAGENGAVMVENTLNDNQRVSDLYAELRIILADLEQRQSQIKQVVSTIRNISDQTHLLALNASIEAAGAGEYGARFRVVAGEVKALADNAVMASRQINEILGHVEEHIQKAAGAAENGHQAMQDALTTAHQSGEVLRQLVVSIYQNSGEIEQIEQAVRQMSDQVREINFATNQQYNASNQALEALHGVGTVASQNASGSLEVIKSTHYLEELSHDLLSVLVS